MIGLGLHLSCLNQSGISFLFWISMLIYFLAICSYLWMISISKILVYVLCFVLANLSILVSIMQIVFWIHYCIDIELPAKLLDYFLRSNKSNINQVDVDFWNGKDLLFKSKQVFSSKNLDTTNTKTSPGACWRAQEEPKERDQPTLVGGEIAKLHGSFMSKRAFLTEYFCIKKIFGWQNPHHIYNPEFGDFQFALKFYGDSSTGMGFTKIWGKIAKLHSQKRCFHGPDADLQATKKFLQPNLRKLTKSNKVSTLKPKKTKTKNRKSKPKKKNQHKNSPPQKKVDSDRLYNNALQKMSADIVHFGHVHWTNFQIKLAHP